MYRIARTSYDAFVLTIRAGTCVRGVGGTARAGRTVRTVGGIGVGSLRGFFLAIRFAKKVVQWNTSRRHVRRKCPKLVAGW